MHRWIVYPANARPTPARRAASRPVLALALALLVAGLGSGCGDDSSGPVDSGPMDAPPGATISVMWQIQDQTNGAALTCQQAGAMVVRLAIIPVDGGSGEVDAFSCDSGSALSREFTPGTYNATITLVGMAGAAPIATSMQSNVELVSGQSKALDAIIFQAAPIAP